MGRNFASSHRYQKPVLEQAGQKLAEHYLDLYHTGIPLRAEQMQLLYDWGFLTKTVEQTDKKTLDYNRDAAIDYDYLIKSGIDPEVPVQRIEWIANDGNPLHPNEAFISFIDSQLRGMSHREKNLQFELYKLQAKQWLDDPDRFSNYPDDDGQIKFINKERFRCLDNSLYGLNKFLWLKEAAVVSGKLKFTAWMPQQVVLWILDCGFSVMIGKLRQVGFTSFIMGRAEMRVRCNKNFFAKFITENIKKAEEIINDKLKYAFTEQPQWFKPTVHNDAPNLFSYIYKPRKGDSEGANSRIVVEAPYVTAINGGSPNEVYVDECGNIDIISPIINEGRPAMFWLNPETQQMVMKRQIVLWGTAGDMEKGGGQFEGEYKNCIEAWRDRNFDYGIVPIFIDCFSKPGITEDFYEKEQKAYYQRAKNRAEEERLKVQFHQAYPRDIEDMFLSSAETLIPLNEINDRLTKIYKISEKQQPQYGRMIPVFDNSQPTPDLYTPYKIIGAIFQPMKVGDADATVVIIDPPVKGWRRRYFQGTDPISGETGLSDFASTIKDAQINKYVAFLRFRSRDHNYAYLQASLLGIFYDPDIAELPEGNIGQDYLDFKKYHGFYRNVVKGARLPRYYQTSTGGDGIKKTPANAPYILTALRNIVQYSPDSIDYSEFWIQLKTFDQQITTGGKIKYATKNPRLYRDDVLDATTYADICASLFANSPPEDMTAPQAKSKKKWRYSMDANYNMVLKKQ